LQSFKSMIAACLIKDQTKRPSATNLLKHPFFRKARSEHNAMKRMINKLPTLGERMQLIKVYAFFLIYLGFIYIFVVMNQ
jgi:serine/threonine-protein kinase OSR1/STK39